MLAIKRDIRRNARTILGSYESIADYVRQEWGLGMRTAELIEDWYWTRG